MQAASVPAWGVVQTLGHKPTLFLATQDRQQGVVLLGSSEDPNLKGVAWWDGDHAAIRTQIEWSRSPATLHSWAASHPVAQQFDALMYLLQAEVRRTAN